MPIFCNSEGNVNSKKLQLSNDQALPNLILLNIPALGRDGELRGLWTGNRENK